ncbi:MAG: hypothetical protein M3441_18520 [Chloroflexota bacterium]|nr:hypothetical protein [Chloroflexota bacterium]
MQRKLWLVRYYSWSSVCLLLVASALNRIVLWVAYLRPTRAVLLHPIMTACLHLLLSPNNRTHESQDEIELEALLQLLIDKT